MAPAHTQPRPSRLPELGRRGEGWVVAQVLFIAAILVSALAGRSWHGGWALAAYAVGGTLIALGAALMLAAGSVLGQALTPLPAPRRDGELVTGDAYALARHPMYGGGLLLALGWSAVWGSLVALVLTAAFATFADLKSRREELWLVERFPEYEAYRRRTRRRLVPFLY